MSCNVFLSKYKYSIRKSVMHEIFFTFSHNVHFFLRSSEVNYLIQPIFLPSISSRPFGDVILKTVMFSNWTDRALLEKGFSLINHNRLYVLKSTRTQGTSFQRHSSQMFLSEVILWTHKLQPEIHCITVSWNQVLCYKL